MDSTWHTIRGTWALNSFSRLESWRRNGWISLKWQCKYEWTRTPTAVTVGERHRSPVNVCTVGQTYCERVCVRGVCLCLHGCYSKAGRGVDSFMCTVWSGLSCNQAYTADNSMITHSHSCIHTHTLNMNCSMQVQNYKEITLPQWFFKSVLYGGTSFVLFCISGRFL